MRRPACSPAHRPWCSAFHAALVQGYRDQRDARDALRESGQVAPAWVAGGDPVSMYQLEDDDFDQAYPRVTFRDWLIAHAGIHREDLAA